MILKIKKMISDDEFEELRKAYRDERKFKIINFEGYLYGSTNITLKLEREKL